MPAVPYPDPPITDGVVTLRGRRPADAAAMAAICDEAEVARWIPLPSPYVEADYFEWVEKSEADREAGLALHFLVVDAEDRPMGSIGLNALDATGGYTEIGYLLGAEFRGRGVMARAVRLLREWSTRELGIERIEILTHLDNEPSQRVARAAGFVETGEYRPAPRGGGDPDTADHKVFAWPGAEDA